MNYPPPQPQPIQPQQPTPQLQIYPNKQPNEKITNWDFKSILIDNNPNKSSEMKRKDMIAPKFEYNYEKSDLSHKSCTDFNIFQNLEVCPNLVPTPLASRVKIDPNEQKLSTKLQSADFKGPDLLTKIRQRQYLIRQNLPKQTPQQQQKSNQFLLSLQPQEEKYLYEQKESMNLIKKVCSEAIDVICKENKLSCNQKDDVTNSLQHFIYQEISYILSFSNQNSRQRTNFYVPSKTMNNYVTSVPKYSQKMLNLEDFFYSNYWDQVYSANSNPGRIPNGNIIDNNNLNVNPSDNIHLHNNSFANSEPYEPRLYNNHTELLDFFRDPSFNNNVHHRYDSEQLAKNVANANRKALTQNGSWKKLLFEKINDSQFKNSFSFLENNTVEFLRSKEANPQQNPQNQVQNSPQPVQQLHAPMIQALSPQTIGMSNVTSPALNPHMGSNPSSMNSRNYLSPAMSNAASPVTSTGMTVPSQPVQARRVASSQKTPPCQRMSKLFRDFYISEDTKKRNSRAINIKDVFQALEMKSRIGHNIRTSNETINNFKLTLYMRDARGNSQGHHQSHQHMQPQQQQQQQQQQMQQQQQQQMQQIQQQIQQFHQ